MDAQETPWTGRITVIKTLCISKFNYATSSIETTKKYNKKNQIASSILYQKQYIHALI